MRHLMSTINLDQQCAEGSIVRLGFREKFTYYIPQMKYITRHKLFLNVYEAYVYRSFSLLLRKKHMALIEWYS